jgi:hypothetical protein
MTLPVHSPFGASKARQWMACPGSVKAQKGLPNPESPWAAEGTKLHDVAATALDVYRGGEWNPDYRLYDLTSEQIEVVRAYVDVIREDTDWGIGANWDRFLIETRVSIPDLHPMFYGTADCIVVRDGKLTVYDLKCGAGVPVEVEYLDGSINPQLAYYMMGAIVALGGAVRIDNIELPRGVVDLEVVIVQPRLGGVKRRMVAVTELLDLARDMWGAAEEAGTHNAIRVAGDHCRFCLAKPTCPALRQHVLDRAKLEFAPEPENLTREDLAALLEEAALIEAWIEAVRQHAKEAMDRGETVPGWTARPGRHGHRKWKDPEDARAALIAWGLPEDVIAPRQLVSPAEAERLAKLHVGEIVDLSDIVERKPPVVTVTRADPKADFEKVAS